MVQRVRVSALRPAAVHEKECPGVSLEVRRQKDARSPLMPPTSRSPPACRPRLMFWQTCRSSVSAVLEEHAAMENDHTIPEKWEGRLPHESSLRSISGNAARGWLRPAGQDVGGREVRGDARGHSRPADHGANRARGRRRVAGAARHPGARDGHSGSDRGWAHDGARSARTSPSCMAKRRRSSSSSMGRCTRASW